MAISLLFRLTLDSSIRSTEQANYFSFQNESISDTLLDKFSNMTGLQNSINDRIITRITITKDTPSKSPINPDTTSTATATSTAATLNGSSKRTGQEPKDYAMTAGDASAASNRTGDTDHHGMTLGISIVQGSDNNVYVKDLVKNGPGDRYGILIGDQVCAPKSHSNSVTITPLEHVTTDTTTESKIIPFVCVYMAVVCLAWANTCFTKCTQQH